MPRSMTGFGQSRRMVGHYAFTVELRTVNSRHFKATIRVPELWTGLEADIEQRLRRRLSRGSVYFVLRAKAEAAGAAYEVNTAALERYIEQLEVVRPDQMDVDLSIDLGSLMQLPGVCVPLEGDEFRQKYGEALAEMVDEALAALVEMRTQEGATIARDLLACCEAIRAGMTRIAQRAPDVLAEYHERLKRRVEELTASAKLQLDADTLAREVAVFAERCDIAEELSRLASHLEQFRTVLTKEGEPGRKLDFIAQEMLREANTISSKANDAEISRSVVEIKTAVDRIKEQVQNLE